MSSSRSSRVVSKVSNGLTDLIDKVIHPGRESEKGPYSGHDDPSRPFTPPPAGPSKEETKDEDDDGPNFPMDPALA